MYSKLRVTLASLSLILLSTLTSTTTVAYFTDSDSTSSTFILGRADTVIKPVRNFTHTFDIIERGGGWSVENGEHSEESGALLKRLLEDEEFYNKASQACTDYMNKNLGSTNLILRIVEDEE